MRKFAKQLCIAGVIFILIPFISALLLIVLSPHNSDGEVFPMFFPWLNVIGMLGVGIAVAGFTYLISGCVIYLVSFLKPKTDSNSDHIYFTILFTRSLCILSLILIPYSFTAVSILQSHSIFELFGISFSTKNTWDEILWQSWISFCSLEADLIGLVFLISAGIVSFISKRKPKGGSNEDTPSIFTA